MSSGNSRRIGEGMIETSHVIERYSRDMVLTPHCHYSIEVNCFRSGRGTYSVAERTWEIRPGAVFVFGSNVIHRITSIDPDEALDVLKVHFSPSILWENPGFAHFDEIFFRTSGYTVIAPDSAYQASIRATLAAMVEESEARAYLWEDSMTSRLFLLCTAIARHIRQNESQLTREQYRSDNHFAISATIEYINQNLGTSLNIDQLARMAKMSKNSYLLWFKHFNGVSPYSYIQSKRVLKAIDLLKQQKMTVTQVAFECGYNNTVSFNKAFKKVMGCTPSDLKKSSL